MALRYSLQISKKKPTSNINSNLDKQRLILISGCVILILLIIFRDLLNVSINKYILVAFCFAVFACLDYEGVVCFLMFLLPLSCGIPGNFIFLTGAVLLLIKRRAAISFLQIAIPIVVIIQELILSFFAVRFSLITSAGYFTMVFLLFFLILEKKEFIDHKKAINYFLIGVVTLLLVMLLETVIEYGWGPVMNGIVRIGYAKTYTNIVSTNLRISNNPNNIGYYAEVAIACSFIMMNRWRGKIIYFVVILISLLVGALTFSRTFVLLLALLLVIYFACSIEFKLRNIISFVLVILFAVLIWHLFIQNSTFFYNYLNRFNSNDLSTAGGRTTLFWEYLIYIYNNPIRFLFGIGAVDYRHTIDISISNSLHSGIEQIFVCYGILGFFLWISTLFASVRLAVSKHKIKFIYFLPIITVILFTQTIQFLNPYELMMPYIIGIYALHLGAQEGNFLTGG